MAPYKKCGGGELIDSGSHIIDIIFWISDSYAKEVYAYFDNYDTEVDIMSGVVSRLNNNSIFTLAVSGDDPSWFEQEIFWCEKGRLTLQNKLRWYEKGKEEIELPLQQVYSTPVFNWLDVIFGKDINKSDARNSLKFVAFAEAAYKSFESKKPEKINEEAEKLLKII